ncbi:universal stress protein UspC [Klebsiella huaxiensis]|uniref:Universal stress protein n=1 Tax=Klebsiella huaxiensis TaxID=2153354 RepID=A0A564J975_9ENTR|nr:universal stress protein UspC [Klebsiella huaxiensis]MDG1644066.1 universal stress protein UspC [Klebsiella huaxiensis]QBG07659.1 universal stress protein UspC [Klebsiella huaxiensis]VUS54436.1 Universal stress protein C [Klebsiella huaxiensis]VUS75221.1 Universal stress protein C [Klebsiella huaxiensis]VUT09306.1 Universal stress protein C [Klebsiella huaxiensis]
MPYSHLLVAVAPTPESRVLIQKAVSIARPINAKVSLITLATDPELYNQFAAPMMENLREIMQEETRGFLAELVHHADYPIEKTIIASGGLGHHVKDFCQQHRVDLVICGNHNQSLFSRATCSAKDIVGSSGVDVLLVCLEKG